jgi:hypothetical protein
MLNKVKILQMDYMFIYVFKPPLGPCSTKVLVHTLDDTSKFTWKVQPRKILFHKNKSYT